MGMQSKQDRSGEVWQCFKASSDRCFQSLNESECCLSLDQSQHLLQPERADGTDQDQENICCGSSDRVRVGFVPGQGLKSLSSFHTALTFSQELNFLLASPRVPHKLRTSLACQGQDSGEANLLHFVSVSVTHEFLVASVLLDGPTLLSASPPRGIVDLWDTCSVKSKESCFLFFPIFFPCQ